MHTDTEPSSGCGSREVNNFANVSVKCLKISSLHDLHPRVKRPSKYSFFNEKLFQSKNIEGPKRFTCQILRYFAGMSLGLQPTGSTLCSRLSEIVINERLKTKHVFLIFCTFR